MCLVYDPRQRKSASEVIDALKGEFDVSPSCGEEKRGTTHKLISASPDFDNKQFKDFQEKLNDDLQVLLSHSKGAKLHPEQATALYKETLGLAQQMTTLYFRAHPEESKTLLSVVYLAAVWMALQTTFEIPGLSIIELCPQLSSICPEPEDFRRIVRNLLLSSLPLLADRFH
jgi:hypothetical protein